jgi:hypothetical protein
MAVHVKIIETTLNDITGLGNKLVDYMTDNGLSLAYPNIIVASYGDDKVKGYLVCYED